ncbi:hypothetical protein GCM10023334_060960 [Nonomuraea thailandensis]
MTRWRTSWWEGGIRGATVSRSGLTRASDRRHSGNVCSSSYATGRCHGFGDDQRWTQGRIKTLIGRMFHIGYTIEGLDKLLRRHGRRCRFPPCVRWNIVTAWRQEACPAREATTTALGGLRPATGVTLLAAVAGRVAGHDSAVLAGNAERAPTLGVGALPIKIVRR